VTAATHRRRAGYGDWELSADRANSGRRKLVEHGVTVAQINKVAGFADRNPLEGSLPDDPINRRLTLLLRVNPDGPSR
jgi:chemotaxis protein MotB